MRRRQAKDNKTQDTPCGGGTSSKGSRNVSRPLAELSASACRDLVFFIHRQPAFGQEQPSQRAQIVQNAAAGSDVEIQFGKIVGDEEKCLFAAAGAFAFRRDNFGLDISPGLFNGLSQHRHVFVRIFDAVKGRFGLIAQ
jgi:hypothetical protein